MSGHGAEQTRLARLRAEFDAAFARARAEVETGRVELLLVGAAGGRLALRLDELAGLEAAGRVLRVPGARPDLAGVTVVGGRLVAVFDLARLSGGACAPPAAPREPGGYVVLLRRDPGVALRFTALEGRAALPADLAARAGVGGPLAPLPIDGQPRDLVYVAHLLEELGRRGEAHT